MSKEKELKGLGGWLILVGLGVVLSPFVLVYAFGPMFYTIFTDGSFEMLTTPGTEVYHALWSPFLITEALYNTIMLFASIYLIYLFFSKHYLFPKVYIILVTISLIFIPLDSWAYTFILPDEPIFDPETMKQFLRTLGAAMIWIPYMLVSKRVRETFVEHIPSA